MKLLSVSGIIVSSETVTVKVHAYGYEIVAGTLTYGSDEWKQLQDPEFTGPLKAMISRKV